MANETTALDILQHQVESLTAELEKITGQRDEYRDSIKTLGAERDSLQSQVSSPDAQAARIAELEAWIRDRNHFDKFAELAKGAKAKDKALKQLCATPRTGATSPSPTTSTRRPFRPPSRNCGVRSTTPSTPPIVASCEWRVARPPRCRQGDQPHQVSAGCR